MASVSTAETADVGTNSLTIACSIAGLTLKFFNCLFRSDFAAFGAFLKTDQFRAHKGNRVSYLKSSMTVLFAASRTMPSASSRSSIRVGT